MTDRYKELMQRVSMLRQTGGLQAYDKALAIREGFKGQWLYSIWKRQNGDILADSYPIYGTELDCKNAARRLAKRFSDSGPLTVEIEGQQMVKRFFI